jgi:radical SAM superfamily enzyme YgiQ (UPF0313 family)
VGRRSENVEPVEFDTDANVVRITGFVIHRRRMFELMEAFRRRGKLVVVGGPFATLCPEELQGRVDVLFVGPPARETCRAQPDSAQGAGFCRSRR